MITPTEAPVADAAGLAMMWLVTTKFPGGYQPGVSF